MYYIRERYFCRQKFKGNQKYLPKWRKDEKGAGNEKWIFCKSRVKLIWKSRNERCSDYKKRFIKNSFSF